MKSKRTNYQIGRDFEYRTRNKLLKMGAVYVMRAAKSKGAADLLVLWPTEWIRGDPNFGSAIATNPPWLVQCKRDGRLPKPERTDLIDIAHETGALPVLAKAGKNGRGVKFINLTNQQEVTGGLSDQIGNGAVSADCESDGGMVEAESSGEKN